MAAYSQKLQNEGQLYGQKENIENQRRMQLASQQAQLDAGRRQAQAGFDEQARQERMMNQANYGPFGNIMGSALSSASNKFLQQRGEDRYFDLMNKMYGQDNNPERPQKPKTSTNIDSSVSNSIMDQNLMEAENSISQGLENIPEMDMTPLEMPVPPLVDVLPEVTVTARRNLSEQDFRENPEKYTYQSPVSKLSSNRNNRINNSRNSVLSSSLPSNNSSFNSLIEGVLEREGGYVNDPLDRGGETNFGISSKANPDIDVSNLTRNQAKQIYKERYWDTINAGSLPENIRETAFDASVNQGPGTTLKWLEQSRNPDGTYDVNKFNMLRYGRYQDIVERDPSQQRFIKGWTNRLSSMSR